MEKIRWAHCDECPLKDQPFVPPSGDYHTEYCFVGEAPGEEEARMGVPFVGVSGRLLRTIITSLGTPEVVCHFTNVVLCRPPGNRTPSEGEIACCKDRLINELEYVSPNRVALLGNTAMETFTGYSTITTIRGAFIKDTPYFVTYHPAYVTRSPDEAFVFIRDIRKFLSWPVGFPYDKPPKVIQLKSAQALMDLFADLDEGTLMAFDFESNQNSWKRNAALLMGITWGKKYRAYILSDDIVNDDPDFGRVMQYACDHFRLIAHNAKFDMHFLRKLGVPNPHVYWDSMLAAYVLDENGEIGLKKLARYYFNLRDYDADYVHQYLKSRNDDWSKVPYESLSQYCAWDVVATLGLQRYQKAELSAEGLLEQPFMTPIMKHLDAVFWMEESGFMVDRELALKAQAELETEQAELLLQLQQMSGHEFLNPRSVQQLQTIIWDEMKLTPPTQAQFDRVRGRIQVGPRSTSEFALIHLASYDDMGRKLRDGNPFIDTLLHYRRVAKIQSTYVCPLLEELDEEGRYHPDVKQTATETGRLATFLHTLPRESSDKYGALIRGLFTVAPGHKLIIADFSQAEFRAWAALSQDPYLIDIYNKDGDVHTNVTEDMFGTKEELGPTMWKEARVVIKRFNFAYVYGGALSSTVSDSALDPAKIPGIVKKYNLALSHANQWKKDQEALMRRQGYVTNLFGRRRRYPFINDINSKDAAKAAVNMPIQSAASDLTMLAGWKLHKEGLRLLMSVHDSLLFEVPEEQADQAAARIVQVMQETAAEYLPQIKWKADVDIKERWGLPHDD